MVWGVKASFEEAIKWTKKAIESGSILALVNMANLYYKGYPNLPKSYLNSFEFYLRAAEKRQLRCFL